MSTITVYLSIRVLKNCLYNWIKGIKLLQQNLRYEYHLQFTYSFIKTPSSKSRSVYCILNVIPPPLIFGLRIKYKPPGPGPLSRYSNRYLLQIYVCMFMYVETSYKVPKVINKKLMLEINKNNASRHFCIVGPLTSKSVIHILRLPNDNF